MTGVQTCALPISGIAIAIGTMVDMGIIICENILKKFEQASLYEDRMKVIFKGASEVGSAIMTAVATTIVSFLPVFAMEGPEGKLFKPLAYTKSFALIASIIVALTVLPAIAHLIYKRKDPNAKKRLPNHFVDMLYIAAGLIVAVLVKWWVGLFLIALGLHRIFGHLLPPRAEEIGRAHV